MMKRSWIWFLLLLVAVKSPLVLAQEGKAELFVGYSFLRLSSPSTAGDFVNLHATNHSGWNAAFTWGFTRHFGVTADFSGHYGENVPGSSGLHTFLFGPKVTVAAGRASLFMHALGGATRGGHSSVLGSISSGAYALGGGFDWNATSRVGLRVAQFDYLRTSLLSSTQNNLRFSSGVVLHF